MAQFSNARTLKSTKNHHDHEHEIHARGPDLAYRWGMVTGLGLITAEQDFPPYYLAALAGVHPSVWSRGVHGQQLRLVDANKIARIFGIDRDELYKPPDAEFLERLPEIKVQLSDANAGASSSGAN